METKALGQIIAALIVAGFFIVGFRRCWCSSPTTAEECVRF